MTNEKTLRGGVAGPGRENNIIIRNIIRSITQYLGVPKNDVMGSSTTSRFQHLSQCVVLTCWESGMGMRQYYNIYSLASSVLMATVDTGLLPILVDANTVN